jgi:flavorubredoxin
MKPIEIAPGIYDVGVTDWNIRDFHGYSTYKGTTYNSFLILDEKTALVDTVKKEYADQFIENIAAVIDPAKIDLVISNHTEMDHAGSLPRVMHRVGEEKPLYCSQMGLKNLPRHFQQRWNFRGVGNKEVLSLGKRSLTFLETRMIHWPDSMFTYVNEDGILFSSDGFGQHYAGWEKFDDQIGDQIMPHAKKYFANILLLYSQKILNLIEIVTALGLKINMICPDHGILWRKDPEKIIRAYVEWSKQKPKAKALIIYDTMWQSTEKMASAIAEGIISEEIETHLMHLRKWHRSDVMTEVLDAGAILIGSPTLNNGLFPTVADFLTYMKGLKPKNKIGQAFGSYGWSGESVKLLHEELEAMNFEIMEPGIRIQYVPDPKGLEDCYLLGRRVGRKLKSI